LVGCALEDEEDVELAETEHAITCPVPAIVTERSLAVTDPAILAKFSFKRVMTRINTNGKSSITPLRLYQDWMNSWATCQAGVDPNGYGIDCERPESQFASFDPFATTGARFVPVGLFNRFDLAPSNGADCGEYRIVYALVDRPGDRAFIIFEARLPNPTPGQGLKGCAPVADFWARLSTDTDVASRATKLERFYFNGLTSGSVTFSPVVTAANYGLGAAANTTGKGQIRTNFFADFTEWHLREFKLKKPCAAGESCRLALSHVTVKTNPADELFRGTHANAPAFQSSFLNQIATLSRKNAATIAMAVGNGHNEFESSSQGQAVQYRSFTQAPFRTTIQGRITNPNLTVNNILDRATTQTCGGCHQLSNNVNLGDGVTWPSSLGFVHVDEGRSLSSALTSSFLPRRLTVLRGFLNNQCGAAPGEAADPNATIGGSALDAH
jgi:hypothetical protein